MSKQPLVDKTKSDPSIDITRCMQHAMKKHGKGLVSQVSDIAKLSFGYGKLSPQEYYYYGLYDDERYSYADKTCFLGDRAHKRIHMRCNDMSWAIVAHDKLAFYAQMAGLGFRVPRLFALYHKVRTFGPVPTQRSPGELAGFLRSGMTYPFFSKPVTGTWSVGVAAIDAREGDELVAATGARIAIDAFIAEISEFFADGYLFQERITVHPEIRAICGNGLSTVRVILMIDDEGARFLHAVWKITSGDNIADNFWRTGNMLAAVDLEDGTVQRVVRGVGPDQEEIETHPASGRPLKGITLPEWPRIKDICVSACQAFPGVKMQAWDVALTEDGPMLLELNIAGDVNLPQIARGRGMLDDGLRSFIATHDKKANGKS